jgi:hypothetical protein
MESRKHGLLKISLKKTNHKYAIQKPHHDHSIQNVRRNFENLPYNRTQDKRWENVVQPAFKRQIDALEEHH